MAAVSVESFDCTKRITGSLQERLVGRLETSLEITIFTLRYIYTTITPSAARATAAKTSTTLQKPRRRSGRRRL